MRLRTILIAALFVLPALTAAWLAVARAESDAAAEKALQEAVKKGQTLWNKSWSAGAKSCSACHARGPNRMTGHRAEAYPLYDKTAGKVITVQQKMNQMIKDRCLGRPLELGSDDLNALEAYVQTLR